MMHGIIAARSIQEHFHALLMADSATIFHAELFPILQVGISTFSLQPLSHNYVLLTYVDIILGHGGGAVEHLYDMSPDAPPSSFSFGIVLFVGRHGRVQFRLRIEVARIVTRFYTPFGL